MKTVKLESAFFLTPSGEEALANYSAWKATSSDKDDDDIKRRKEKLLAAGLVKEAVKLKGGYKTRVLDILKKEKKPITADELTDKLNEVLEKEDEGQKTTLKGVTFWLSCHGEDAKIVNSKNWKKPLLGSKYSI
jgi:hypothetical protein